MQSVDGARRAPLHSDAHEIPVVDATLLRCVIPAPCGTIEVVARLYHIHHVGALDASENIHDALPTVARRVANRHVAVAQEERMRPFCRRRVHGREMIGEQHFEVWRSPTGQRVVDVRENRRLVRDGAAVAPAEVRRCVARSESEP